MSTATSTEGRDTRPPENGRQQVSVLHLVMGLIFLGIAASWALRAADLIGPVEVQWLMPAILVVAGAAGLLASFARGYSGRRGSPSTSEAAPPDAE